MTLHHKAARVDSLFAAFVSKTNTTFKIHDGTEKSGRVTAIEHEDGSGVSFNVTITNSFGGKETFYFRCYG